MILDASFFINGRYSLVKGVTTSKVVEELKTSSYEIFLSSDVRIEEPSPCYVSLVRKKLREIGERKLSEADISVLALSLQRKEPLVTDDYNLQNVALLLGIEVYDTGMGRVRSIRVYERKCPVCGKRTEKEICTSCGTKTKVNAIPAGKGGK